MYSTSRGPALIQHLLLPRRPKLATGFLPRVEPCRLGKAASPRCVEEVSVPGLILVPFQAAVRSKYDAGTCAVVFWVWSVSEFVLSHVEVYLLPELPAPSVYPLPVRCARVARRTAVSAREGPPRSLPARGPRQPSQHAWLLVPLQGLCGVRQPRFCGSRGLLVSCLSQVLASQSIRGLLVCRFTGLGLLDVLQTSFGRHRARETAAQLACGGLRVLCFC